jgi:uncharacterized membrane protein
VGGEVLVGAGCVLARPLVELLAGGAGGAVYVQAQGALPIADVLSVIRESSVIAFTVEVNVSTVALMRVSNTGYSAVIT